MFLVYTVFFGKKGHKGIDVSHHQGNINWTKVATEGEVEFVYLKATEGATYVDNMYKKYLKGARKAELLVGPYHFFRADKTGEEQFNNFSKLIGNDFDLVPMLDLEDLGGKIKDKAKYKKEVQSFIDLFVQKYGYKPIVYGSHSFMKDNVLPVTKDCDYWLAWYLPLSKVIKDKRRFINGTRPGLHPCMWQYSEKGSIPGIEKDVDLDECWEIEDIKVKSYKNKQK